MVNRGDWPRRVRVSVHGSGNPYSVHPAVMGQLIVLSEPGQEESGRPPCALRSAWLKQMECVYHGGCITSLVTSDVSPINTHGGGQLLKQQNVMVEKSLGMPGPDATPII